MTLVANEDAVILRNMMAQATVPAEKKSDEVLALSDSDELAVATVVAIEGACGPFNIRPSRVDGFARLLAA